MGPCPGCEQQPERDCLVGSGMVPSRFGDESIKQRENVTSRSSGSVAQWKSARMVSERPWVRVPVGQRSFSAPVTHTSNLRFISVML